MGGGAQEGRDIYMVMADSHCCMAETNTTMQSNYPPIKINLKIIAKEQNILNESKTIFKFFWQTSFPRINIS